MPYLDVESFEELENLRILPEYVLLPGERARETEMELTGKHEVQQRALHGFVLIHGGEPGCIVPFELSDDFWSQIRFVGYAASLLGVPGLWTQSGHWVVDAIKPVLMSIDSILSVDLRSDPAFRHGEECLWLRTARYEYALMDPFTFYQSLWSFTRSGYLASEHRSVDLDGPLPAWWPTENTSDWEKLIEARKEAARPFIRKQIPSSRLLGQTGRSPYHPQRTGVAPVVDNVRARPGRKDIGKRPAAVEDDAWEGGAIAPLGDLPGASKRSRVYSADQLEALLARSLQLQDQSVSGPDLTLNLETALPNAIYHTPWSF